MKTRPLNNAKVFSCLQKRDVVSAKISDHHPVIHHGVLFWNVMMQGKSRGTGYNNAFALIETEQQYIRRLLKIANVIIELISKDASIEIISLCEGPIKPVHIMMMLETLQASPFMSKFFKPIPYLTSFHQPDISGYATNADNHGILMLANRRYQVEAIHCDALFHDPSLNKLINRLQLWKLSKGDKTKILGLAHFPFSGDEEIIERKNLSSAGNIYCEFVNRLLEKHANDEFIFCADFNLNPYLINKWEHRTLDEIPSNNSLLLTKPYTNFSTKELMVDGILLSALEKQKIYSLRFNPGLFARLKLERQLSLTENEYKQPFSAKH